MKVYLTRLATDRPARALQSLVGGLLVRRALSVDFGLDRNVEIGRDELGKPQLRGVSGLHFNIAHSGDRVALVVDDRPVGIDVQRIGGTSVLVGKRNFHASEWAALCHRRGSEQVAYFHWLWAMKESYVKQTGQGLRTRFSSFYVAAEQGEFRIRGEDGVAEPVHLRLHALEATYVVAVCATSPVPCEAPQEVPISTLRTTVRLPPSSDPAT
ncbi:4'-phosphopantetheinyl transferase superfamily protein [Streptomyces sp. NPDC006514]|uniref:4'-phosphopantetheinyl transferase family protein n=1 Tax=Streptomyces sp. NPDC006514 TaxID=3154308 RepID=UPI0033A5EE36